jgi:3-hydroxyisobutyrate dehydrogenase-like beta-hydroxyacid dehydrogenase
MEVAVLGLGAMGTAIARRLEAAGVDLTVFNRSSPPTREFQERGIRVAVSPAEATADADLVISMLSDGPAVEAVLLGDRGVLSARSSRQRTIVEMSTIDVATSQRIAERAEQLGCGYLRAPVSGNPGVVAAGALTILVSGERQAFDTARGILLEIGPNIFYLGEAEEARVMKLALNLMVGGTMQLLAEALTMGESSGLVRAEMLDVIKGSVVGSPLVKYKAGPLVVDDYATTFSARLMHKDLGLAIQCANGAGVPLPATALVQQLLQGCIGLGLGELDFSVLLARLQREAGGNITPPAQQ